MLQLLQTKWTDYRYFPIDEEWQRQACRLLNLHGPDVILTLPDTFHLRHIYGDGNY